MIIICQYNKELEHFLENAVEYTLRKYGEELNLVNLQEIELMDISEFDLQKDGAYSARDRFKFCVNVKN